MSAGETWGQGEPLQGMRENGSEGNLWPGGGICALVFHWTKREGLINMCGNYHQQETIAATTRNSLKHSGRATGGILNWGGTSLMCFYH